MALPAVAALVGKLAASSAVQSAATKVAGDIYERIMSPKQPSRREKVTLELLAERLDQTATREELIASFSALQAELDQRQNRTSLLIMAVIVLQMFLFALLFLR